MVAGVDAVVNARDLALFVDQEADATRVTRLGIVARAVGHPEGAVGVAQQREVEGVLLRKGGVVLDSIEARTQDDDLVFDKIILLVAEPAPFGGSAGSVSLGVEPQQHFLPAQAVE